MAAYRERLRLEARYCKLRGGETDGQFEERLSAVEKHANLELRYKAEQVR